MNVGDLVMYENYGRYVYAKVAYDENTKAWYTVSYYANDFIKLLKEENKTWDDVASVYRPRYYSSDPIYRRKKEITHKQEVLLSGGAMNGQVTVAKHTENEIILLDEESWHKVEHIYRRTRRLHSYGPVFEYAGTQEAVADADSQIAFKRRKVDAGAN